ncbi:MAG: hypothetical protein J0I47_05430 [Sphingomonas sp.]|uniref:hypothetical protein n=1 Tax=Sphingomonas sp. TaxID=28214 RepID=UPI001ACC344F|nr:hypothetical protein [Sphingomonas sp.]MBN8807666.1 hypothetical protein [Sphingomonas sp.]
MWRYVKIPLVVALLAFVLPWLSISLFGQHLLSATGWQLASGHAQAQVGDLTVRSSGDQINYYMTVALALTAAALIASFLRRSVAVVVAILSVLAMALIWAGSNQYNQSRIDAAAAKAGGIFGSLAATGVQVEWQIGYWVALIALAIAAVVAFLAIRDPS